MAKNKKKKGLCDKIRHSKSKQGLSSELEKVRKNPFEVKINKQKHNILGRKTKHDHGLPGVSRSKANKKRKETLLQEYRQRNKANNIKDERFGAGDAQISLEEKMLQRFSLEKKRKHEKMSQFNLEDVELTHLGQSLSTTEKFDDVMDSDEDDIGGTISGEYTEHAHFGGGIFTKKADEDAYEGGKSRKDVIDEIIAKSKKAKFEKQSTKEKSDELREKLDDAWKDFQKLLQPSMRTYYDKEDARQKTKPDDFDIAVREMLFARKAAPAERSKTVEELAAEEAALLKKQDEERRLRMQMDPDIDGEKPTHQSADALDEDFYLEEDTAEDVATLSFMPEEAESEGGVSNDETCHDEGDLDNLEEESETETGDLGIVDDGDSLDADEQESTSDDYSDIDSGNEDDNDVESFKDEEEDIEEFGNKEDHEAESVQLKSKFPSSYSEFLAFSSSTGVESDTAASETTSKLRAEFAPGVGKGNKAKMIELFAYLWEHCCNKASDQPPRIKVISNLTRHLYELCQLNTESCAQCVVERLKRSYHFCFKSSKSSRSPWPSIEILLQFKLIKLLFSTSDFCHGVVTPAMLFMCNILNNCRVLNVSDVARGLFVCTLIYEYVCFSKRFVPECLNFLVSVLCMAVDKSEHAVQDLPEIATLRLNKKNLNLLVVEEIVEEDKVEAPDLMRLLSDKSSESSDQAKCQLLRVTLRLAEQFISLYSDLPAFEEIFFPLKSVTSALVKPKKSAGKAVLSQQAASLIVTISSFSGIARKPLSFGKAKPKPLRMFDPKIEECGEPFQKRSKKLNAAKRERERLIHKRRREMKGAMREIRKDTKFLSRQQQQDQQEMDEERAAKVKRLFGFLSNQEGEVKNIQRKKYKLEI